MQRDIFITLIIILLNINACFQANYANILVNISGKKSM